MGQQQLVQRILGDHVDCSSDVVSMSNVFSIEAELHVWWIRVVTVITPRNDLQARASVSQQATKKQANIKQAATGSQKAHRSGLSSSHYMSQMSFNMSFNLLYLK
jgi:hypothetical protein